MKIFPNLPRNGSYKILRKNIIKRTWRSLQCFLLSIQGTTMVCVYSFQHWTADHDCISSWGSCSTKSHSFPHCEQGPWLESIFCNPSESQGFQDKSYSFVQKGIMHVTKEKKSSQLQQKHKRKEVHSYRPCKSWSPDSLGKITMHVLIHVSSKKPPKLRQAFVVIQTANTFWLYPTIHSKIKYYTLIFMDLRKKKFCIIHLFTKHPIQKVRWQEIYSHYFSPGFLTGKWIKCF